MVFYVIRLDVWSKTVLPPSWKGVYSKRKNFEWVSFKEKVCVHEIKKEATKVIRKSTKYIFKVFPDSHFGSFYPQNLVLDP